MPEELSPESKLYVKEEIDKVREKIEEQVKDTKKAIEEQVKKARSGSMRTFSIVTAVVAFLVGVGVYGSAVKYMDKAISKGLEDAGLTESVKRAEELVADANRSNAAIGKMKEQAGLSIKSINDIEKEAEKKLSEMGPGKQLVDPNGYTWVGDIKVIWGTEMSERDRGETFEFEDQGFPNACFAVITNLPGTIYEPDSPKYQPNTHFRLDRIGDLRGGGPRVFTYVAIGH